VRILVFIAHYLPAQNFGGPLLANASMIEHLGEHDFYVFASETDLDAKAVLPGIFVDAWQKHGRAQVFYASSEARRPARLVSLVREVNPEVIYLNSFFARRFTIPVLMLRRLGRLPKIPVVLCPHGEFSPGALSLKRRKKALYLAAAKAVGLYRDILWHSTSPEETRAIRAVWGREAPLVEAANFPPLSWSGTKLDRVPKKHGEARLAFLSRISRKKNLGFAIELLSRVRETVTLDVYGPLEDERYWRECLVASSQLLPAGTLRYCGTVPFGKASEVLARYDALILPTLGENYGYVVVEAWAAGTPVLISNRTPWRGLEDEKAGWDLPLDDVRAWQDALKHLVSMDEAEHGRWREASRGRALRLERETSDLRETYRELFLTAVGRSRA
jgi:glycosyltransferase involved in cell wall biosynthesis